MLTVELVNGELRVKGGSDVAGLDGKSLVDLKGMERKAGRMTKRMRWLDGSFLTRQQATGEAADAAEDRPQQKIDPL